MKPNLANVKFHVTYALDLLTPKSVIFVNGKRVQVTLSPSNNDVERAIILLRNVKQELNQLIQQ